MYNAKLILLCLTLLTWLAPVTDSHARRSMMFHSSRNITKAIHMNTRALRPKFIIHSKYAAPIIALHLENKTLTAGDKEGRIHVWNLQTGQRISMEETGSKDVSNLPLFQLKQKKPTCTLKQFDIQLTSPLTGKLVTLAGHTAAINTIILSDDNKYLFSGSDDRTVRIWDLSTEKELARLVAMRDGWGVISPEGFFDGPLDGNIEDRLDALGWQVGNRSFTLDGFIESYYSPALLGRLLQQKEIPIQKELPKIAEGFQLPPTTTISKPEPTKDPGKIKITVEATDQGGGIKEIRLFHNGKRVNTKPVIIKSGKIKTEVFTIKAMNGENGFTAVSLSRDKIEGETITSTPFTTTFAKIFAPDLHIVSIGINKYKNPYLDLDYAVSDAKSVSDYFGINHKLFNKVHRYELYNRNATQTRIQTTLDLLSTVPARDTVVIFISGHGDTLAGEWKFVPYDLTNPTDQNALAVKSVSASTLQLLVAKISAHHIFLLIDSCKSGAILDAFGEYDMQQNFAIISRSQGIHIGASTTREQFAGELTSLGHGLFTFALLKGLEGEADMNSDGKINVSETLFFIKKKMAALIKENHIPPQRPTTSSRGLDFTLTTDKL